MYRMEQWFADRLGIAVLTIDGRGTPGSVAWEKAVHRDFSVTLDDQIEGSTPRPSAGLPRSGPRRDPRLVLRG
jgi:hypothetical protein